MVVSEWWVSTGWDVMEVNGGGPCVIKDWGSLEVSDGG